MINKETYTMSFHLLQEQQVMNDAVSWLLD